MIKRAILEFEGEKEPVEVENLFAFDADRDYSTLISIEACVDTRELSLSFLGNTFPGIRKMRLNNSIIPSVRDIGCTLVNLRYLSLARCNLTSLDGICTISSSLEELYLAMNKLTDVCDLMGMEKLKILDLEDNLIPDLKETEVLTFCPKLRALTLAGNPGALTAPDYRARIAALLPDLVYLDEKRLRPRSAKSPRPPAPPISLEEAKKKREEELEAEPAVPEMIKDMVEDEIPTSRVPKVDFFGKRHDNVLVKSMKGTGKLIRPRPLSARGRPM